MERGPDTKKPMLASIGSIVRPGFENSVADGDAGNIGALQRPAHRLGLIALQPRKAGAEQFSVILGDDRLGKGIGLVEHAAGLVAGGLDALSRFAFAFQRADLDDPSAAGGGRDDGLDSTVLR